jgi:gamma-glutamylcyclotransferase (GGCT)/AIG2-like uncharacterized protein YtfP
MRLIHRLFVYGTLTQGEDRHGLLRRANHLGEAWTEPRYTLHDLGSCPAMTSGGRTAVRGELYEVVGPIMMLLDRYEWHPRYYRRERIHLYDGGRAVAYLVAPGRIRGVPRIASGDWRRRRRPMPRIPRTIFAG